MSPRKKGIIDNREWLVKHLSPLIEMGREIKLRDAILPITPPPYVKGYWTGLKLILVRYYMPGYLNILAPRRRIAYVDLFAGPGLNLIGRGNTLIPIPGSPLLPWVMTGTVHQFDSIILNEFKSEYVEALKIRVGHYNTSNRIFIHEGDANVFVSELPIVLDKRRIQHCLVFIDPEGLDFKFKSLEKLIYNTKCDVIINFPSAGLIRNLVQPDAATEVTIRDFLGLSLEDSLPQSESEAIALYRSKLKSLGKDVSTEIMISSGEGPFHYHLIPAVRRTSSGSPWFRILQEAKNNIEKFKGDILGVIADQIEGRLTMIDDFP